MAWRLDRKRHSEPVARFLAASITRAAELAPRKWGTTPYGEGGIRLNVGFCEAITTRTDELRLLVLAEELRERVSDRHLQVDGTATEPFYPSAPGSALVTVPYEPADRLADLLQRLREPHDSILAVSAEAGFNYGARRGHRDEVVDALSELVGRPLPYPLYSHAAQSYRALPEEIPKADEPFTEGATVSIPGNRYERDGAARRACVESSGFRCAVCEVLLSEIYGDAAARLIHVHHRVPLAEIGEAYEVDPESDLIPVCPNCHAVIHRRRPEPYTPEEVRRMIRETNRRRSAQPSSEPC